MKNYIFVDENNVVQICSAGGKITGGIEVDNIPAEVWSCPQKYKYIDGVYADNPDYVAPSEEPTEGDDLAAIAIDHEFRLTMLELGITEL